MIIKKIENILVQFKDLPAFVIEAALVRRVKQNMSEDLTKRQGIAHAFRMVQNLFHFPTLGIDLLLLQIDVELLNLLRMLQNY